MSYYRSINHGCSLTKEGFHRASPLSEKSKAPYSILNCRKVIWMLRCDANSLLHARSSPQRSPLSPTRRNTQCVSGTFGCACFFKSAFLFSLSKELPCYNSLFCLLPRCLSATKSNSNNQTYPASQPFLSPQRKQREGEKKLPADHPGVPNLTGKGESCMTCICWSGWWEARGCQKDRPQSLTNL